MESTWEQRDLPVLDAIVRYFDEDDSAVIPDVGTFAAITRMDPVLVGRAVRALSPRFIKTAPGLGGLTEVGIMGVTDEARQAVGQWPTPESVAERIVAALAEAADGEPDQGKRTKLRTAADALGGFGRELLVNVIANVATKPISF